MNVNSPITPHPALQSKSRPMSMQRDPALHFATPEEMLGFITRNWRANFVTVDLQRKHDLEDFAIRPFFILLSVDAPVLSRFERSQRSVIWCALNVSSEG
jgi:dCMP deaminase